MGWRKGNEKDNMISELEKIEAIENLVDKKAYFMSLLTQEAEKKNIRPIVVGGSAVEGLLKILKKN